MLSWAPLKKRKYISECHFWLNSEAIKRLIPQRFETRLQHEIMMQCRIQLLFVKY